MKLGCLWVYGSLSIMEMKEGKESIPGSERLRTRGSSNVKEVSDMMENFRNADGKRGWG